MKKKFTKPLLAIILVSGILFVFVDLLKEETFTIIEKDTDTLIWIKSNKLFNPTYKRASLGLENARIINTNDEEIDYRELVIGNKIKADFNSTVLLSDPPVLTASKILLLK